MLYNEVMAQAPTVTVILPVLDAADDIEDLLKSLQAQEGIDKSHIEVLLVNDGSHDSTLDVVEQNKYLLQDFASFRTISHERREGLARTRLDGARSAKGKFITFIDKKCRPDTDYLSSFVQKGRNIVIGSPYTDKGKGIWTRALSLVKMKLYYPYFNHPFEDIELDSEAYAKFKNKGGGGSMFVLREYFLDVSKNMSTGVHVNDDSLLISELSNIEPILKTADAKIEYLNRTGFIENIVHLYNRGPKFVDFYAKPGRRFFVPIVLLVVLLLLNIAMLIVNPVFVLYELIAIVVLSFVAALYLANDVDDFFAALIIAPLSLFVFSAGVVRGVILKLSGKI